MTSIAPETIEIPCIGYAVVADWYRGKSTDQIILCLIGYTSNRKRYRNRLPGIVTDTGMSALTFDYSGHGDSPFSIEVVRPAENFLEVINTFDWLKQKYPNAHMNVIGSSYGGFLATQLTKYRAFDKLILRAPAIYPPKDFYTLKKDMDAQWITNNYRKDSKVLAAHPMLTRASEFKGKTLVVVHENDEAVSKQTTDAYIKAFGAEVYVAKDFPHSLNNVPEALQVAYHQKISDWLKSN